MLSDLHRPNHDGSPIFGAFRLTHYRERRYPEGEAQGVLTLEDASGRYDQIIADEDLTPIRAFRCPGLVRGFIQPVTDDVRTKAIVLSMAEIDPDDIDNGAALLPRAECSDEALPALRALIAFNQSISNPVLRSFLNRVLLDDNLAYALMSKSAGLGSANSYKGGLLVHATEWLDEAGQLANHAFPPSRYGDHASDWVTLTQIAYLLHDLNRSLMDDLSLTFSGWGQAKLTLQLLQPHLGWLSQMHPGFAQTLQTLLMPNDGQKGVLQQVHTARTVIRWCDNQRQTRDLARAWARQIGEPAPNDPVVALPNSVWTVSHV